MVHRPTSYIVGESPSFLQVIGIIVAVIVGLAIFVCILLSAMACCVLLCCPSKANNTAAARRRPFFRNLNPAPRLDIVTNVNETAQRPQFQPTPTAPPLIPATAYQDNINGIPPTHEEIHPPRKVSNNHPPSYAEVIKSGY